MEFTKLQSKMAKKIFEINLLMQSKSISIFMRKSTKREFEFYENNEHFKSTSFPIMCIYLLMHFILINNYLGKFLQN